VVVTVSTDAVITDVVITDVVVMVIMDVVVCDHGNEPLNNDFETTPLTPNCLCVALLMDFACGASNNGSFATAYVLRGP
jgi:hypothetical protein